MVTLRGIFSIGHSTLPYEQFLTLLRRVGVDAVADVRTSPYSRYLPHFNQKELCSELKQDGIAYVFLGKELGGRPTGANFYCEGVADYEKMASTEAFNAGIDRVVAGGERYRIALMCSEKHPLDCHRCLLVGRQLLRRGIDVQHIMSKGSTIPQTRIEEELLTLVGQNADDLFSAREERLQTAYRLQARKVAFSTSDPGRPPPVAAE
ncbi:DUF488 family protein [Methylocystis parvus]|uniref:DUF488 domain-containing protein n=1 Tax=Methylocystis parvus TaxID=134 RepID=A0A6B8M7F8_9HYPH|nr:DUF488 domain-containing protein [Methylocystis parvus]QGM98771.1 DUF488 domain-containing protein [Methylocystis parvus]WBK00878.1 DUF488 domain-containing protein [Methylocystis parvus OBBP]